jgi:acyl dehydratase
MYLEDYQPGRVFELPPVSVSLAEILEFARSFDPQPLHVDAGAAAAGPFGEIIASGWHTCALTMRALVADYFSAESSLVSPGIDELRWVAPVRAGDTLTARVTVIENRPSNSRPDRGLIRSQVENVNQDGTLVLSFVAMNLILRRP